MKFSSLNIYSILIISILILTSASVIGQQTRSLPENFPEIQVNVHNNPEPGYIFITPSGLWGFFMDATPFLVIVDNNGIPVFYQELTLPAFDFKLQTNGLLSFNDGGFGRLNFIMDSSYQIVNSIEISGYSGTDFHDFKILENGNYLLLGWEDRLVDMDTVVPGGQTGATVRGTLIQEKDKADNILWQWSSWDHFKITETDTSHVDLVNSVFIDYIHTNAVFQDSDSTVLISSRNMHEITKISKNTGEIKWRMGGSQNEFAFIGEDTLGFGGQHDIRRRENGNYLLFDNGWLHPEQVSSALELTLDEVNKTASVVKRYRSQPEDIRGWIMGSCQRLPGGNTLVGWGSGVPNVTEFKPDGTKALELEYESVSYRSYKFPWKNNIFTCSSDTIDYGEIYYSGVANKSILITNYNDENIVITWLHNHTDKYHCLTELPLLIEAGATEEIIVQFEPVEIGTYDDILTIYAEKENQTIISSFAQQVNLLGSASQDASIAQYDSGQFSIYPNPTKGIVRITRYTAKEEIEYIITNIQGQIVQTGLMPTGVSSFSLDLHKEVSGVYFIQLRGIQTENTRTLKILKD